MWRSRHEEGQPAGSTGARVGRAWAPGSADLGWGLAQPSAGCVVLGKSLCVSELGVLICTVGQERFGEITCGKLLAQGLAR